MPLLDHAGIDFIPEKRPLIEGGEALHVVSEFEPAGDQPEAIGELTASIRDGDKDQVLSHLQQHLQTPHSAINWSQFAQDHAVPGNNAGQVLKEFAHTSGLDTSALDGKELGTYRTRIHKRRLMGGEISAGSTPTPAAVREEWKKLVETGELSLGNPCVPYKMMRFATKEGQLVREEVTITGRKFPLIEIRQHLLDQHEKYMRLNTDAEIDNMSFADICTLCKLYHHQVPQMLRLIICAPLLSTINEIVH